MKNLKKIINIFSFLLLLFFVKVNLLFAQLGGGDVGVDSADWFEDVITFIIGLAGVIAAAVLIFNAYLYITASGDEGKVQKATKGITYAIVGLILAAIAFLLVNFVIERAGSI